jgi:hypothetical protein
MKVRANVVSLLLLTFLLGGCCNNIKSAINSYAITAQKETDVMEMNLNNCLKAPDQASKDASCNALRNNIKTFRDSFQDLKTNTGS